jgi:hypothetical protein
MVHADALTVLANIAAADGLTYGIVGALTLIVSVVMRAMLPVKGLASVFAPAVFWGGLVGIYAAGRLGLAVSSEKAVNHAATAALGMIAALLAMVLLTRLVGAVMRIRTPLAGEARHLRG